MHSPCLSNELVQPPIYDEVEWSKEHKKEIHLLKYLSAYFLGFGATGITSMMVAFPLFIKTVWQTKTATPGVIMALGEALGVLFLALSMMASKKEEDADTPGRYTPRGSMEVDFDEDEDEQNGCSGTGPQL